MRFTVFRECKTGEEVRRILLRRHLAGSPVDGVHADDVMVTPERVLGDVARWRFTLDLADYHDDSPDDGTVRLLVEENEHCRPATYSEQPVAVAIDAAWRTEFQEAEARYSGYINLEDFT